MSANTVYTGLVRMSSLSCNQSRSPLNEGYGLHLVGFQRHSKLPITVGAVDLGSPSFAIRVLRSQEVVVSERNARLFYSVCAHQLKHLVVLEPLPSGGVRAGAQGSSDLSVKKGKIEKRRARKLKQKTKKRGAGAPSPKTY